MYIYTFDYQLNSDDGIIGYGNLQISYQEKMNHDDFEDARLQILNRAKRDYETDPRNRMMRGGGGALLRLCRS
jgi:hypothetical protein